MAEPPHDDPLINAPTQVGRDAKQPGTSDANLGTLAPDGGREIDPLDATLIRNRVRSLDRQSEDAAGVTPEVQGRYHYDHELGRGGIGRVVIAFDRHLTRQVAIKELLPTAYPRHPDDTTGDLARFLREARITGQLEHPSIVPVYELGQRTNGSLYYAMKVVRGRTLREAIDDTRSFRERMALLRHFVDVANAIAYAHSRGVVHRDVKPENVMLGEFGETVVLDWGLAKFRDKSDPNRTTLQQQLRRIQGTDAPETLMGEVVGTPAYMSPEQAGGAIDSVNERSDVWSLGVVLYELLTGKAPFKGKNVELLLYQVITGDFEPVRAIAPDAPADLAAIAEKALSKDPDDRYPNARALVEDVIAFQNGRQVGAYHYSAWELIKKFAHEYRVAAIAGVLITLTVAIGAVATLTGYRRAVAEQARAEVAQTRAVEAQRLAEQNERRAHDNLSVALAEKARLLTDTLDFGAAGVYAAAAIYNSPYFDSSPFHAPDLAQMDAHALATAQLGPRSALYEVLVRRQLTLTTTLPTDGVHACAFAMDSSGQRLLSSDADGRYMSWDLIRRKALSSHKGPLCPRQISLDADGRRALILTHARSAMLMDLRTGQTDPIVAHEDTLRAVLFGTDADIVYLVGASKEIVRMRLSDRKILASTKLKAPRCARLDPSGEMLAVGTRWGVVEVLDATTLKRKRRFKDHESTVWGISFSPDGTQVVAGGYEGHAVIRNVTSGDRVATLPGTLPVYDVAFAPGGQHVIGTGFERGRVWGIDQSVVVQRFRVYGRGVRFLAVRDRSREIITSGFGPDVQVWRFAERPLAREYAGHAPPTYGLATSADGQRMATTDGQGRIRAWSTESAEQQWTAVEPTVWALAFSGDSLLSISSRGRVVLWSSTGEGKTLQENLASRRGSHVGITATRDVAAWTGSGPEIVIYNRTEDRIVDRFIELIDQSSEVAISDAGRLLAAADGSGNLVVWGIEDRVVRWRSRAHDGIISGLSFTADGQTLASTGQDGMIRLWRAVDGVKLGSLHGHDDWINEVAFSQDGQWLLSGSDDGTARLWAVPDRRPVLSISAGSQANAVGFHHPLQSPVRLVIGRDQRFISAPVKVDALNLPAETLLREAERSAGLRLEGFKLVPIASPKP